MNKRNFITTWIRTLSTESIKYFPTDFSFECESKTYELPQRGLLIGKEFFGEYELITTEGSEILRVENYEKAKFFNYSNRNKPRLLPVPIENFVIKEMTVKYEDYLDSIIKRIERDYRNKFSNAKNVNETLNEIFKHLNLIRLK